MVRASKADQQLKANFDPAQPIPVQVMNQGPKSPWEGKYPSIDDPIEKREYRFIYNQNPGTPLEFTKNRSVLNKAGRPTLIPESYCLEDDNVYELPIDVAKHLNSKTYFEEGVLRPRCSCVEV